MTELPKCLLIIFKYLIPAVTLEDTVIPTCASCQEKVKRTWREKLSPRFHLCLLLGEGEKELPGEED